MQPLKMLLISLTICLLLSSVGCADKRIPPPPIPDTEVIAVDIQKAATVPVAKTIPLQKGTIVLPDGTTRSSFNTPENVRALMQNVTRLKTENRLLRAAIGYYDISIDKLKEIILQYKRDNPDAIIHETLISE